MKHKLKVFSESVRDNFSDAERGDRKKAHCQKRENKGFTLVELIVVIVILAILAAILIPGLLKWIDEAKEKQYMLEAKSICQAAQAEAVKMYGRGEELEVELNGGIYGGVLFSEDSNPEEFDNIEKISGIDSIESVMIVFTHRDDVGYTGELGAVDIIYTPAGRTETIRIYWHAEVTNGEWIIL